MTSIAIKDWDVHQDLVKYGMANNKERTLLEPVDGWQERTYYVVDVCYGTGNPVHRAILYVGFFGSKHPLYGGYTTMLSASYEYNCASINDVWYLRPISIIEGLER